MKWLVGIVLVFVLVVGTALGQEGMAFPYDGLRNCTQQEYQWVWDGNGMQPMYALDDWIQGAAASGEGLTNPVHIANGWQVYADLLEMEFPACRQIQKFKYHIGMGIFFTIIGLEFSSDYKANLAGYDALPYQFIIDSINEDAERHFAIAMSEMPQ